MLFRFGLAIWLTVSALGAAQRGRVTFGGLPLPGASVTALQGDRKALSVTDGQGSYVFPELEGDWTIRVEMQCFEAAERVVPSGQAAEWELSLLPVDKMHAATVSGGYQKTVAPAAATTIAEPAKQKEEATAPLPNPDLAVDGFLINGTTNNAATSPFSLANAFGNSRKGPGSSYNGSLGLILDNSALDARSFSLTGQETPRPSYNHLTGLAAFGGPIRIPHFLKNGGNLFVNYQWTRDRTAVTQTGRMPTLAERAGDGLSADRISPQARALLPLFPLPNFDGGARYNYQTVVEGAKHQDSLQTRWNRTAGRKDNLSATFAMQSTRASNGNLFGFQDTTGSLGLNTGATWRHALTNRLSVSLGYQFSRLRTRVTPYFANRLNISGLAGIRGNVQDPLDWGPPDLSFASGISPLSDAVASLTRNQTSAVPMTGFWSRGRHNVSFGGDVRRQQFNLLGQQNPRGEFAFTGAGGADFMSFLQGIPDTSAVAFGNADKYLRAWANDAYMTDDWRISPGLTVNIGLRWEYGSPIQEKYGRLVDLALTPNYTSAAPVLGGDLVPYRRGFQPRLALAWRPAAASSLVVRAGYGVYDNTSIYQGIATQMAQQPPLSTAVRLQNTAANPLTLADGFRAPAGVTLNTFAVDPRFRPGYTHNWQVSIQRELPKALVLQATYNGIKGTREVQTFLPNTYPAGAADPCPTCPAGFTYLTSNGNSTRESGQVQLRRRLQAGFTATLQYTWSKSIDDAALGGRGQGQAVVAQDWLNLSGERGLSNFDQRHLLSVQTQYTTPTRWKGLREWTFVTQTSAGSGLPLTPIYLAAVNGTGVTGSIRPDYTGAPLYLAGGGLFLNPAAYAKPAPGHWGNAGRGSITGPSQLTVLASLGRTLRLRDKYSMDIRMDAQNPINHVTYTAWNTMVTSGQFGLPVAANAMRSVQTTLRVRF